MLLSVDKFLKMSKECSKMLGYDEHTVATYTESDGSSGPRKGRDRPPLSEVGGGGKRRGGGRDLSHIGR